MARARASPAPFPFSRKIQPTPQTTHNTTPNTKRYWGLQWDHVVSDDLVTWTKLPPAIAPTPGWFDADGCFSGDVTVDPETGAPVILYTGVYLRSNADAVGRLGLPPPAHADSFVYCLKPIADNDSQSIGTVLPHCLEFIRQHRSEAVAATFHGGTSSELLPQGVDPQTGHRRVGAESRQTQPLREHCTALHYRVPTSQA